MLEYDDGFPLDAWIIGGRPVHDRVAYHVGQELALNVVLDEAIGGYAARTPVQLVIADLYARIMALEGGNHIVRTLTLDAVVLGTSGVIGTGTKRGAFALVSTIKRAQAVTFTLDAFVAKGTVFRLDAVIEAEQLGFDLYAWVI